MLKSVKSSQNYGSISQCQNDRDEGTQEGSESTSESTDEPVLDTGYAWVVAGTSFMYNFLVDGVTMSYGVLSRSVTSSAEITEFEFHACGSFMMGTVLLIGPLVSLLIQKVGFKNVAILGSLLSSFGFLLVWALATSSPLAGLVVGFGLLVGLGFGLLFTMSIVILGKFFKENLALATGICTTGGAVGSIIFPKVLAWFADRIGWESAFLFLSALCCIAASFGTLYEMRQYKDDNQKVSERTENPTKLLQAEQLRSLLKSISFWIITLSGGISLLGYFVPLAFITDRAMSPPFNATLDEATWLPSITGISNTIGRIPFGLLANSERTKYSISLYNLALTVGGVATILSVYAQSFWHLAVYAFVYGQMLAVYNTLRSVIVYQVVGKEYFNLGFGMSLVVMGFTLYFGNSFAGWLKSSTGSYDAAFIYAGSFITASAVIAYPVPIIMKLKSNRSRR